MGRIRTIARRTFLTGAVAVAGGVAFGTWWLSRDHDNPLAEGLEEGQAAFNPWVKVTGAGVTLIAPHTDLGQGARHVQALLIAEELDVDPMTVRIEPGQPSPAYYNAAFADEGVPFMPRDTGLMAETARGAVGHLIRALGLQGTGGSTTVTDSFDKLRMAGAVARETLKEAAAQAEGLDRAALGTKDGAVILPDGRTIPYGDLAAAAAGVAPVQDVTLRAPEEWRLIGKPGPRLDVAAKSTGRTTYGIDLVHEGMVHAALRLNPRPGGEMLSHDPAPALAIEGVQQVVPVTGGVAVIAGDTWTAFEGARAITAEWGPAPFPAEQDDHWAAVAGAFTDERLDKEWRADGDALGAVSGAGDAAIRAEYRAPYVAHAPLEPLSALILVGEDRADIWAGHQIPGYAEAMVAEITGIAPEQVHLHNQYTGGSFGHRLEFDNIRLAAEIGAQLRGVPVKLTYDRETDMAHDYPRQIAMARAGGTVAGGQVTGLNLEIASPSVLASQMGRLGVPVAGPDTQIAAGAWIMPYALPDLRVAAYRAPNLAPISSWRSVGASSSGFFAESALDELIHAAGADPMEERLRLCDYPVARGCLEAVAEMSGWGRDPGPDRGLGVALVISFGVPVAEVVEVENTPSGIAIRKVWVAADVGRVVDPVNFENLVQGGVIWGLGHAINSEITYADGAAEQTNYHAHEGMRLYQAPEIEVRGLETNHRVRGIGEPPVPPAAPALANAIFAATGERLREMPFARFMRFV